MTRLFLAVLCAALGQFHPSRTLAAEPTLFKGEAGCSRSFVYRNRTYPVDSSRKQDGEGLRFVLKNAAPAEAMLNDYQSKIRASFVPAYITTGGIALALAGSIYANGRGSYLGRRDTTYGFLFAGILTAVSGYAYGQMLIHEKEKTLEKAIETYNDAVPDPDRIRVGLIPTPTGDGGEIKTEVPF